jgi:hypothetical protein
MLIDTYVDGLRRRQKECDVKRRDLGTKARHSLNLEIVLDMQEVGTRVCEQA